MARRKQGDPISDILGANTQRTHSEPNTKGTHSEQAEHTKRTRSEHWSERAKTELATFSVRLAPEDIEALRGYFETRGLGISQGIRMWIRERMEEEGLR